MIKLAMPNMFESIAGWLLDPSPDGVTSWGDILRANRDDSPLDAEIVLEDLLDAEVIDA